MLKSALGSGPERGDKVAIHRFGEVTETLRRSTVQVRTGRNGSGSGIIWTAGGQVITNAHVVRANGIQIELWNGRQLSARLLKKDQRRDLASLAVEGDGLPSAAAGDSDSLRAGEIVIAVGNPYGFIGAVSTGVIHGVGPLAGFVDGRWIVSDVRLAPGNSGGPLADAAGRVIGVNTMIAGGLALAIPSRSVMEFLARPAGAPPRLGVTVRPVRLEGGSENLALLVLEIAPQSAADRASLLPGDVLISAGKRQFRSADDLEDALQASAGGRLEIEFRRGGNGQLRRVVAQVGLESVRAA
jgi:serine protease Do